MTEPIIIKHLCYRYPNSSDNILDDINLKISEGKISAFTGLSGSGKTTLCYCMCGIIPHIYGGKISGEVLLFGKSVKEMELSKIATRVGIVFQEPDTQLFSPTVEDEVAFGPENLCLGVNEIGKKIKSSLKAVGMEYKRYEHPQHLSGGEKQVIAIASVLSLNPDVLIFDEVMSGLDRKGKLRIKEVILKLKDMGKSIVIIGHDLDNLDVADCLMELKENTLHKFSYQK